MKTPVSYYGGKQRLASKIVPMIPKHTVYVEPFAGGGAVMFRKPWPAITSQSDYREVINDLDGDLINFWKQLRDNGPELVEKLQLTLYSKGEHKLSKELDIEDASERARRYYVNSQQSFGYKNKNRGGWGRGLFTKNSACTWMNKVSELADYVSRMQGVYIEHDDALKCIERWDSPQTFFYVDPPYPGTEQGYQHKYSQEDFANLCEVLCDIQGSFILSCYEVGLEGLVDWERIEFETTCSAKGRSGYDRSKKGDETNQNRTRTEVVYRKLSTAPLRPEIQKLYNSGKFDCFTG